MRDDAGGLRVRALVEADFDVWLPLWRGYQAFYAVDLPPEVTRLTFTRLVDDGEPMAGALAILDGQAVGLAHHIRHRSTWTSGDTCYLQDLFTDASVRGRGVGRALIAHVRAAAAAAGCTRLYWLTHETNATAMALYDRVAQRSGFVQYRMALSAPRETASA